MQPQRILVVVTRRIGDVLLATPVLRSLKRAWPLARTDALVFRGTEGVLAANPDIERVLTVAERQKPHEHLRFHASLLRRYDLALSLLTGDRPTLYAFVAGRFRAGLQMNSRKEAWKQRLLDLSVAFDGLDTHTVRMNLALAGALGIEPVAEVVVAWSAEDARHVNQMAPGWDRAPFAVLHPFPKFNYKRWPLAGWTEVARWLDQRHLRIFLSGGPDREEIAYVAALAGRLGGDAVNLAGQVSLGALGCLLSKAAVYIGPDTAVTHMAAALGVPTVAIFGPSNPVRWGPWPKGFAAIRNPWTRFGSQRQGNVILVQGTGACVPCLLEGCERHIASYSDCLQQLPARRVIAAAEELLAANPVPA